MKNRRWWLKTQAINLGIALLVFAAIQLIPVGHDTPPTRSEPVWDSPQTYQLAQRACYDCHSYQTEWPWYAKIAPVSWITWYDVTEGREDLNFSDWGRALASDPLPDEETVRKPLAERIRHEIESDEMPPRSYRLMHPDARLSEAEKQALIEGLLQTIELSREVQ